MPSPVTLQLPQRGLHMVRPVSLRVVDGPTAGFESDARLPPLRVGSAPGNEVVVEDPTVSRYHFSIQSGDEGLSLRDAGSTNGVWVGGHRVREAIVDHGSRITVGESVLEVRLGEAEVAPVEPQVHFGGLIGVSQKMQTFLRSLEKVAPTTVPILIEGETGTGKEVAARAVHDQGGLSEAPFIVVDCGAVASTLLESALFGHQRGAFTGAEVERPGAFVAADGGTIFLDEIGELSLELQPKLLRALEAQTVTPLGAHEAVPFSARIVAATHRDLRRMVNEGLFREDLYFRLAVFPLQIPPLRDRPDDVVALGRTFFREALAMLQDVPSPVPELDPESTRWLRAQAWSGNVRELRNVIQRAVIVSEPAARSQGALAAALRRATHDKPRGGAPSPGLEIAKKNFERAYLLDLLRRHEGNHVQAAEEAKIHPKSLQRLVRRYGLKGELP